VMTITLDSTNITANPKEHDNLITNTYRQSETLSPIYLDNIFSTQFSLKVKCQDKNQYK
jgi:hypothetical protein